MAESERQAYSFGPFRVDVTNRLLWRDGAPVPLTLKAFDSLLVLLQHRGRVLSRVELMRAVWPGTVVSENNLSQAISAVRKALREGGGIQVETFARRGYRLVGEVLETREPGGAPPTPREPPNAEGRRAYLRGRHLWGRRTAASLRKAIDCFREAIRRDPGYAPAHAALASALGVIGCYYAPPREAFPQAKAAAHRALELDATLAEAHTALGGVHLLFDWDWAAAERALGRALALDPGNTEARQLTAWRLAAGGRLAEAQEALEAAHALDPLSLPIGRDRGVVAYWSRRPEDALRALDEVLELDPGFVQARLWSARAARQIGRFDRAVTECEQARAAVAGSDPLVLAELAQSYAAAGRPDDARAALRALEKPRRGVYVSPAAVASVHLALGAVGPALAGLERAWRERTPALVFLAVEPTWDTLRGDSRFQDLRRRLGLGHPP